VHRRSFARSSALALPVLFALAACASLPSLPGLTRKKTNDGLIEVDELLSRVEAVQVEAQLGRQRSGDAYEALRAILAADFDGDPVAAYAQLSDALESSKQQAEKLAKSVAPMKKTAEGVFEEWTASLESFGSTEMRQRSQTRLEESRSRYDAILTKAVSAQLAYDAFNADLEDHALFLEHDFNTAAVAAIEDEVESLGERARELDGRLQSCAAASKAYLESSALRGQLAVPGSEVRSGARSDAGAAPRKRRAKPVTPPASDEEEAVEPELEGTP